MPIETLRPNAVGDEEGISQATSPSGRHWEDVDEVIADDTLTNVVNTTTVWERDLYNIPAHTTGSDQINFVKIYLRCWRYLTGDVAGRPALKSNGVVTDGTTIVLPSAPTTYSEQWSTNPSTGVPWEWSEIDALQIGISLMKGFCTQVYVEVDYAEQRLFYLNVGQGAMAITGVTSTIKRIHWLVGQSTLIINGTFKTTLDRILKILSLGTAKNLNIICAPIGGSNMPNFIAGETVICSMETQDEEGAPKDPTKGVEITITNPQGNIVVDEGAMTRDELGKYHYDYNSSPMDSGGSYGVRYTTIDGTRITIAGTSFTIQ